MPVVAITLEETNRSVLSSVYYKIIEDVADTVKIPKESLVVLYNNQEVSLTDNKPNVSIKEGPNLPTATTKRRIEAKINESYNEDHLDTTAVTRQEFYPIFNDPEISVQIAPVYIQTDIEIEFKYTTPSKSEIERIRDDIRLRLSQNRSIGHHSVEYNIIIPSVIEEFIADIHELKNRLRPQELGEYFLENTTNRLHQITDMSNKDNIRLAIHEKQIRIVGFYEFNSMPEKADTDGETSTHSLSFTYKFSFTAPKAMSIRYPVMICNTVLPAKYVSFIEEHKINSGREFKQNLNYIGTSLADLSHFEAHRQIENRVDINVPINIPLFDDFSLRQGHKGYGIVMSILVQVDETDNKTLFNLKDIDPYYIPDEILEYIRTVDKDYIVTPYASFMYLGVHQENKYYDNPMLEIDSDLNVRSKVPLNIMKPTRVTLSVVIDFSMLHHQAVRRINDNPIIKKIFISEYISAVNTFKNEIDRRNTSDGSFYNYLIHSLDDALKIDDFDTIKDILDLTSKDNYVGSTLGDILVNGYPELLERVNKENLISLLPPNNMIHINTPNDDKRYDDPYSRDSQDRIEDLKNNQHNPVIEKDARYRVDRGAMRTTMVSYVVALRRE